MGGSTGSARAAVCACVLATVCCWMLDWLRLKPQPPARSPILDLALTPCTHPPVHRYACCARRWTSSRPAPASAGRWCRATCGRAPWRRSSTWSSTASSRVGAGAELALSGRRRALACLPSPGCDCVAGRLGSRVLAASSPPLCRWPPATLLQARSRAATSPPLWWPRSGRPTSRTRRLQIRGPWLSRTSRHVCAHAVVVLAVVVLAVRACYLFILLPCCTGLQTEFHLPALPVP